ncbi:MAG: 30S ribosomal protein S20 [Bacteroidota bacterium]|nr:30S ribosomal protein S20 [Bacteroidota bacterium]
MPQHKSAAKRARQDAQKRLRNRRHRSRMRTKVKKVLESDDVSQVQSDYLEAQSGLDHLAAKGIIHRNQAANVKKRLARHIHALSEA